MANNAGTPNVRPIPTDTHSGFRLLRVGALSLAGRMNTQGEAIMAATTESSVRFPCPPRLVVGVPLTAAIPPSPSPDSSRSLSGDCGGFAGPRGSTGA